MLLINRNFYPLLSIAALLIVIALTAAFWDYTQDDVFITYAYSRNLAVGEGFVFNPGERVQGTTTPLYTLLMVGVHALTTDPLHAGNLLSAIFLLITALLIVALLRPLTSRYTQGGAVLVLITAPLVYVSFGMETLLYCALLHSSFLLWTRGDRENALFMAALLTWTRADGVVLGASLILVILWEKFQQPTAQKLPLSQRMIRTLQDRAVWRSGVLYLLWIMPWYGFALLYFGSPLPNTFGAKQHFLGGIQFWSEGWKWWRAFYANNPLSLLAGPLIGIGLGRALTLDRLRPLALWAIGYAAGYTALNTTAFWYYTPWFSVLVILAALGGEVVCRYVLTYRVPRRGVIGVGVALILLTAGLAAGRGVVRYAEPPGRVNTYKMIGQWIERHTAEDSTLLIGDLGIMGYYAQRPTLDSPGLIVPAMYFKTDAYATAKYKPDLIVGTGYYTWVALTAAAWFKSYYQPLAGFSTPGDIFSPMTVYQRRFPLQNPIQVVQGTEAALHCEVRLAAGAAVPRETRWRILDAAGETVLEKNQPFLAGQYPQPTTPDTEILQEQIIINADFPLGAYLWEVNCGVDRNGRLEVIALDQAAGYLPLDQSWGSFARLQGMATPQGAEAWAGGSLLLWLDWAALGAADQDYSVLLHLVPLTSEIPAAQGDGYPRGGQRPVSGWLAGERITDARLIPIPYTTPAGEYRLLLGWYNWQTGERVEKVVELPIRIKIHSAMES